MPTIPIIRTQITFIRTQTTEILFPPKNTQQTLSSTLAALDRQRIARIVRATSYVFATIATMATMILTEGHLITWPIAIPAIAIAITSWALFFWIHRLDAHYLDGIDDNKRKEIAIAELQNLLFNRKLNSFPDTASLLLAFENINKILWCQVITAEFMQNLQTIKERSSGDKTVAEAAEELKVSLAIACQKEAVLQGGFGQLPVTKKLDLQWTGNQADPIQLVIA